MPPKTKTKDNSQQIKESSNQAIKYLILILASIAIIQILSVILIASSPQAYNQSQNQRLKAITQKLLNKNKQKYYCENQTDCVDGSYCEETDKGCVNIDWWQKNVGYKHDCKPYTSPCECVNNKCEKRKEITTPSAEIDDKYYCENQTDCVDGSYCEQTDDGCVSYKWWEKNVGYKVDSKFIEDLKKASGREK